MKTLLAFVFFLLSGCGGGSSGNMFDGLRDTFGGGGGKKPGEDRSKDETPECRYSQYTADAVITGISGSDMTNTYVWLEVQSGPATGTYQSTVPVKCIDDSGIKINDWVQVLVWIVHDKRCSEPSVARLIFDETECQ
jgi:hypothetical protein